MFWRIFSYDWTLSFCHKVVKQQLSWKKIVLKIVFILYWKQYSFLVMEISRLNRKFPTKMNDPKKYYIKNKDCFLFSVIKVRIKSIVFRAQHQNVFITFWVSFVHYPYVYRSRFVAVHLFAFWCYTLAHRDFITIDLFSATVFFSHIWMYTCAHQTSAVHIEKLIKSLILILLRTLKPRGIYLMIGHVRCFCTHDCVYFGACIHPAY